MHVKKMSTSDKLAVLFLIVLFTSGVALGTLIGVHATRKQPEPEVVHVIHCEAKAEEATPTAAEVVELEPQTTDLGEFKLTAYCTCEKCCGEWADGVTYTGTQATAGRTIAVDPDVIPLGSKVYINGAEYIAEDIGGAIQGKRIDVLLPSHEAALQFGIQYADVSILN